MDDLHKRVEEQIPRMRRYARALTRDVDRADDLVQDTLCRALSKLHLWQEGTDLRAWLFTILHNQYVNQVRRGVREGLELTVAVEQTMVQPPGQEHRLELCDLDRALALLPDEQRILVLLVGLESIPYEKAAAIVGVPVGTVRSRLSRARAALRQRMGVIDPNRSEALPVSASPVAA